jgi:hypothetical protein
LKQIAILSILTIVFIGCNQKQVVELKLPPQYQTNKVIEVKKEKTEENNNTIVEEFVPMDIIESDVSTK